MTEDQKLHKQYTFEDYMKTVLRNKARNIHKKLDIQEMCIRDRLIRAYLHTACREKESGSRNRSIK